MVLMLDLLLAGVLLGLVTGGRLRALSRMTFRGEWLFFAALVLQLLLPRVLSVSGSQAELTVLVAAWGFPALIATVVAVVNWRTPGFALVALGLAMNLLVVAVNQGMPVMVENAVAVGADPQAAIAALDRSWLHHAADMDTQLLYLADVLPLPGPAWHRGLLSLGDVVLAAGAGVAIFGAMHAEDSIA